MEFSAWLYVAPSALRSQPAIHGSPQHLHSQKVLIKEIKSTVLMAKRSNFSKPVQNIMSTSFLSVDFARHKRHDLWQVTKI